MTEPATVKPQITFAMCGAPREPEPDDFAVRFERVRQLALAMKSARRDYVALPWHSVVPDERNRLRDVYAVAWNAYEEACEEFFLNADERSAS